MRKEYIEYKNILAGISVFMLFLAIPKLPYGYYTLLRWVITISALFSAWVSHNSEHKFWVFLMGGIAILLNPIIPVHLTKDIWVVIDLIVAILFLVSIFTIKPKRQLPKEEKARNLEKKVSQNLEKERLVIQRLQRKRDEEFFKCWKKGMRDEELAKKFNLEIEGVRALKERLKLEDKVASRSKLRSKIITSSLLIIAVTLTAIAVKTFVGAPPTKEKDILQEWRKRTEKVNVEEWLKQPVGGKELSELDRLLLGYSPTEPGPKKPFLRHEELPKKLHEIQASI